ncbi:MAG: glycosyltransferase, partial [Thermoguttaceae bacterium]|nr:glycosyltransferase [Thermoguttaceae bacterium]
HLAAGFSSSRIHRIPAGVVIPPARHDDARRAARETLADVSASLKLPDDSPLAVYTGRLLRNRGLPELVAAWRHVADQRPDARLWLVGEGRAQRALEDQIEALGLVGNVVLAGVFDHVDEILAAADLAVQPAHEGGLSLAVLEAMAAGLPVVASDIADHRDLIDDGQTGLLVRTPTPERLAAAILRLVGDPPLARRLGQAARERAIERYALERQVAEYARLFERLIDSG